MTDPVIIAASYAAERNYSHNPDDVIDASGASGAWGTAKESTAELTDLSGNGITATVHGPMPAEGFIQGRLFTANNSNWIDCGYNITLDDIIEIDVLIKQPAFQSSTKDICYRRNGFKGVRIASDSSGKIRGIVGDGTSLHTIYSDTTLTNSRITHIKLSINNDLVTLYIDGVPQADSKTVVMENSTSAFLIGTGAGYFNGDIYHVIAIAHNHSTASNFNSLARLPFWAVNYTDYPDNVTEYTDNLPYSSSIISSGTFKVDDDKLQCVSAGTITYSASYEFDGSEYIKVEIDGVEYAGTGTITQGNTTVSVAQGSNKVTIQMGTGDTIEGEIGIQFREEV